MKRRLLVLAGILILSLAIVGVAYAFTIGNVDGVWGYIDGVTETSSSGTEGASCSRWATGAGDSPTSVSNWNTGVQTGSTTDENQVRYGTGGNISNCTNSSNSPQGFGNQSGFGFDGYNGPVSPAANIPFYLGKFTHYNNPISATNSFGYVNLNTTVPITCNDGTTMTSFSFTTRFDLNETPNQTPCEFPGSSVCPDKVEVTQPTAQSFTCPDGDYTVNILGFTKTGLNGQACDQSFNASAVATEYITEESTDNVACLWAEISPPKADISPDKTCADFTSTDPYYRIVTTNAGPGSARQVKIVDTIPTGAGFDTPLVYTSQLTTSSGTVNQGTCSASGQTITCELLTSLPSTTYDATAKWTVDIMVYSTVSEPTPLTNSVTASTTTTDPVPGNNTDSCTSEAPTAVTVLQPTASAVGQAILVEWQTTSEVNILGFNLYRSTLLDGPRTLVNQTPAKHPGINLPGDYEYNDTDVLAGVSYIYWLEVQGTDGTVTMEPVTANLPQTALKLFLPAIKR